MRLDGLRGLVLIPLVVGGLCLSDESRSEERIQQFKWVSPRHPQYYLSRIPELRRDVTETKRVTFFNMKVIEIPLSADRRSSQLLVLYDSPGWCGSGGCRFAVFARQRPNASYREVGWGRADEGALPVLMDLSATKNGMRTFFTFDIRTLDGVPGFACLKHEWNGRTYVETNHVVKSPGPCPAVLQ